MKISVTLEGGGTAPATLPHATCEYVTIAAACPACGAAGPTRVRGVGRHHDHDTYRARAIALCCASPIGELRARVSTIFGIDEDIRVLHGRPRVY